MELNRAYRRLERREAQSLVLPLCSLKKAFQGREYKITIPKGWLEKSVLRERPISCIAHKIENKIHNFAARIDRPAFFDAASCCQLLNGLGNRTEPRK